MNYLAHVAIAEPTSEARLGALLGDFARGLDEESLPEATRRALHEHRAVDVEFDARPEVRRARALFPGELRRYAGILVDVFVDHFLVLEWSELRPAHLVDVELGEVTASLYRALQDHAAALPPRLARVAPSMSRHDWLGSYGDVRNVERALIGIERRLRRPAGLVRGLDVLVSRRDELARLTRDVFPDMARWAARRREGRRADADQLGPSK